MEPSVAAPDRREKSVAPPGRPGRPPRSGFAAAVGPVLRWMGRRARPLPWIGPAIILIALVVLLPVVLMIRDSFRNIDDIGFDHGWAGTQNFKTLFNEPDLGSIVTRTAVWVVVVVAITVVISLALAQLFNQKFPGRTITRWALIAPWAASVYMTGLIFQWMLNANSGFINLFLHDIGLLKTLGGHDASWLGRPTAAFWWMVGVAVFVSIPFTTYALLAGLQTIPGELYEAARVDGASTWRSYWSITFPLLRPALIVAMLINIINVFNNFAIIWSMTRGAPGHETATTTIFMYQLKANSIPEAAAMSVVNFGLVLIVVFLFLALTNRNRREAA
jgi:multiple sugar transport system permease protein